VEHPVTHFSKFQIRKILPYEVIMSGGKKGTLSVSLPVDMIDWLDASAKAQAIPSRSKAVRCCLNCVALGDVKMVQEGDCASSVPIPDNQELSVELAPQQIDWVNSIVSKSEGSDQSEVIRSVIKACVNADEEVVFGVVRCKSKVTACKGAQEAVALLGKKYGKDNVTVKEEIKLK